MVTIDNAGGDLDGFGDRDFGVECEGKIEILLKKIIYNKKNTNRFFANNLLVVGSRFNSH